MIDRDTVNAVRVHRDGCTALTVVVGGVACSPFTTVHYLVDRTEGVRILCVIIPLMTAVDLPAVRIALLNWDNWDE